jgi:hypothetical protein
VATRVAAPGRSATCEASRLIYTVILGACLSRPPTEGFYCAKLIAEYMAGCRGVYPMAKRKRGSTTRHPEPEPAPFPLTFHGLDVCDGCGTRLAPGGRLTGLCAACLARVAKMPS